MIQESHQIKNLDNINEYEANYSLHLHPSHVRNKNINNNPYNKNKTLTKNKKRHTEQNDFISNIINSIKSIFKKIKILLKEDFHQIDEVENKKNSFEKRKITILNNKRRKTTKKY